MTQNIELDVHAHLIPVDEDRLAQIDGVVWDDKDQAMTLDGHRVGIKPIFKPTALRDWMDENRVAHAYISAPPPLYRQQLRDAASRLWSGYINDGLTKIASQSNGRFTALVHLPTEDPIIAAQIVHDYAGRGACHFAMPAGTGDDRTLGMEAFEPVWAALNAARAFVFFHPGECADGRLKAFYLTNLLGNPYESGVALAHLIFARVFERYPQIIPCFAHGGGVLPMIAGRFERGFETNRPGLDISSSAPSATIEHIYADCICHSEAAATLAEETFGKNNIVFGSDWPFPMGLMAPHEQLKDFDAERRQRYFESNGAALRAQMDAKE